MPQPETSAWWSDVQHVRDSIERKREREARRGLRLDARSAARAVAEREEGESASRPGEIPPVAADAGEMPSGVRDFMESDDFEWATRPRRRFERSAPERRGRFSRAEHGPSGHAAEAPVPLPAPPRRRTVEITGRTVGAPTLPRLVQIDRRRPARRPAERVGARPDRIALWAVVLAFFLIFVAVTSSSHAATRADSASAASSRAVHQQHIQAHTATLRAIPPAR
jgi:hypothetical protein